MTRTEPPDLVHVCDWLPPDFGAVGQYAEIATRERAFRGESVVLVGLTSGRGEVVAERIGLGRRLTVRLSAARYDRSRLGRRLLWTVATNTRLLLAALPHMRRARMVTFTGSPPLFLHWIALANLLLRRPLTYRITDFHPECLIAGRGGRAGLCLKAVLALTWFWRRRIDRFEVVGRDQIARLTAGGVPPERIVLARDRSPLPAGDPARPAPRPPGTEGRRLLLYSGNLGYAHDTGTFLDGYRRHHREGSGRVLLWLNATGQRAEPLRAALRRDGLPFVDGAPVPIGRLASLLLAADAHLVTLAAGFEGLVMPSKVYAAIDSGRPILFVGRAASDVHALCIEAGVPSYRRAEPGDCAAVAAALEALATAPAGSPAIAPARPLVLADRESPALVAAGAATLGHTGP